MTKINVKSTKTTKVKNYEGGEAYELSPEMKLLNLSSTCLFKEPKFYGKVDDIEEEIFKTIDIVAKKDPKFILQLATYLRTELYLRTISTVMLVRAANIIDCKPYVHKYTPKIIQRADEITEALAYHIQAYGQQHPDDSEKTVKKIPNSLKKGIADSFKKFDEYQFGKYNRKGQVTFKDAIMLTHPKEPSETIKKILNETLKVPYTWETELSKKGNKKEVWEQLIDSGKFPYFAMIRNLRNILNAGISDNHLDKVINYTSDKNNVMKSKLFPFRFFSAYRELDNMERGWDDDYYFNDFDDNDKKPVNARTSDVLDALEDAIKISYENIPYMKGTTLIACDVSGSMETSVSKRSKLQYFDIGLLLGSAMHKYTDKGIIGMFGDTWKQIQLGKSSSGIIANTIKMHEREGEVGYATNGYKVIEWLNNTNTHVDRILIITDCQMWDTDYRYGFNNQESTIRKEYNEYKKKINPNVNLYLFNLNGYGTISFPKEDKSVINVNGWSDRILKFIQVHEADPDAQIKYIKEKY